MRDKTYVLVALLFLGSMVLAYYSTLRSTKKILTFSAKQNAIAVSNALSVFRTAYTQHVVSKVKGSQFEATHSFQNENTGIPLPASMTILLGEKIGELGFGSKSSLYSPYPFPWRTSGGLNDDFKREAWDYLTKHPEGEFFRIDENDGQQVIRYAKADVMRDSCIKCHNTHPETPKKGWKLGDVRGILEVVQPIDAIIDKGKQEVYEFSLLLLLSGFIGFSGIVLVIASFRSKLRNQVVLQCNLRQLNSELEQFAYRTSHDLKSPLTTIKGLSQFAEEDLDAGDLSEVKLNLKRINQHAEKLEILVTELLLLAQADLKSTNAEAIDITPILGFIKQSHRDILREKKIELSIHISLSATMIAHRLKVTQILENLISNSIKYSDPHKEKSTIEVKVEDTFDGYRLVVQDNGLGIPKSKQNMVFSAFTRFHPKHAEGSGLGLAIVQKYVTSLKGIVHFDSSKNGTMMTVEIPRESL